MYINVYSPRSYSYINKNFQALEEAKDYLRLSRCPEFKTESGEYVARFEDKYGDSWKITIKEGNMPDEGEGYVDMLKESGALEVDYS